MKHHPDNDDIFIFCYPKGTVLTDDNYLDYLAFWSGTSGPGMDVRGE